VESLAAENTSLRSEIGRLTESSEKLRLENSALMVMNLFPMPLYTTFRRCHVNLPFL
jgi:hypothetical protein